MPVPSRSPSGSTTTSSFGRDSVWFIVKPGHEIEDVEDVVQWHETFNVVAKRAGRAAEIAQDADPRG